MKVNEYVLELLHKGRDLHGQNKKCLIFWTYNKGTEIRLTETNNSGQDRGKTLGWKKVTVLASKYLTLDRSYSPGGKHGT